MRKFADEKFRPQPVMFDGMSIGQRMI